MINLRIMVSIAVVLFFEPCAAKDFSRKPIIDSDFKLIEVKIKQESEECQKTAKGPRSFRAIKCYKTIKNKYERQGFLRGTDEYCRKKYEHLSFKSLEKEFFKIKKQKKAARFDDVEKTEPGELTFNILQIEEFWIESRLAQMQQTRMDEIEKSFNKKDLTK